MFVFELLMLTLWGYPIITFIVALATRKHPNAGKRIFNTALVLSAASIFSLLTTISTTLQDLDWFILSSVYFTICLGLWRVFFHRRFQELAVIGMFIIFGFGYVGFLGIGLGIGEYITLNKWLGNGIIFKQAGLGNAISDYRGTRVEIYKTIPWLPLLEWRVQKKEYYNIVVYMKPMTVDYKPELKTIYLSATWEDNHEDAYLYNWNDTLFLPK